ncbi:hypothetical protein Tsubulata_016906 [Turnera subulata]|uniref:Pentatricopeptide repeat-containing protein n=1 Tax=Turnera subulata TaxID=218843 RepID=A0A9Q0G2V5_9ROSI|nr:hypothetical protein Tsubulata_016906 [Turnera subulata]
MKAGVSEFDLLQHINEDSPKLAAAQLYKTPTKAKPTALSKARRLLTTKTTQSQSLTKLKQLHAHATTSGLLCSRQSTHFRSRLASSYAFSGHVSYATKLFDELPQRNTLLYNHMIRMHINAGLFAKVVKLFVEMLRPGDSCPDNLNDLKDGRCLHGWVIKEKLNAEVAVETSLIDLYAKCNRLDLSFAVFMRTSRKRTVPWNALLSGCIHNARATEAIRLFKQMLMEEVDLHYATFNSLLPAYAILADLQPGSNVSGHSLI